MNTFQLLSFLRRKLESGNGEFLVLEGFLWGEERRFILVTSSPSFCIMPMSVDVAVRLALRAWKQEMVEQLTELASQELARCC